MTPAFLLMLIVVVVVPCTFVLGVTVGWDRGRDHAERSMAMAIVNLRTNEIVDLRDRASVDAGGDRG